jgi:ankyrin repeat protein
LCRESKVSTDVLKAHADSTREHFENEAVRYLDEEHRNCHQAFKNSTYEQFKNINPDRVDQTCGWALTHPLYQRWRDSATDDLLWISADPGCGKSVLSKALVDKDLRPGISEITICYFFFKDNREQNNLATALCALLHQLFQQQPHLLRHAISAWKKDGSRLQQETDELWRILLTATSDVAVRNTICVLDALDECKDTDRRSLIAKLSRFHENASSQTARRSWLKFVVTSRPYDEIQRDFHDVTTTLPIIRLHGEEENDQIRAEINHVIEIRVSQLEAEHRFKKDLRVRLTRKLLLMRHRTYLWLHLAMDAIRIALTSPRPDEEAIEAVPLSVEAAYEDILDRVPKERKDDARTILKIVIGARRPLTVAEMALAFGAATDKQGRRSKDVEIDPDHLKTHLRNWCGLFVFIDHSKIYLIHQTAREFLVRQGSEGMEYAINKTWRHCIQKAQTEHMMAVICIRCLNLEDRDALLGHKPSNDSSVVRESREEFIEYCCEWWTNHYSLSQDASGEDTLQDVLALYDTEGEAFKFWFDRFWTKTRQYDLAKSMTPVRLAALSNHNRILKHFLDRVGVRIDAKDESGRTALYWASKLGHDKSVRMLLNKGADVNTQGERYGSALQVASAGGHAKIVQMLLDRGADVNAQDGEYGSALQAASAGGSDRIVQMLLDRRAKVNAQGGRYGSALQAASAGGHAKIVQMLLDRCVDVNAQGGRYSSALRAASAEGHDKIVQMLLDRGAKINAQGRRYSSALQEASAEGYGKIVQLLLNGGADVNAQGGGYGSALQAASAGGHDKIVQMLLDRGADVNAQGGEYSSALRAASAGGHAKIVQMLLDRGADVNAQGGRYGSALRAALPGGHAKIVQMLLDRGAKVDAQGGEYGSVLRAASAEGHDGMVQILLDRGADVNAQGGRYGSALQAASARGHAKIVQMLLDRGADVDAQGGGYSSALRAASAGGHAKIVQMLLDRGADVDAQGGGYSSALRAASARGHNKIVQMLLDRGADFNAQGGRYGDALQVASARGYDKIVQTLLVRGADVNAQGGEYSSALQAASAGGHAKIVQMLLDRGADVNAQGGRYGSALQAASAGGHDKIMQILLDRGTCLTVEALFSCLSRRSTAIVPLILPYLAEDLVFQEDADHGNTLLHRAAELGYRDLTTRCLVLNANVDVTNKCGKTPLHHAAESGHLDIVQILIQANADRTILDLQGRTALQCAQEACSGSGRGSYSDIVAYLQR